MRRFGDEILGKIENLFVEIDKSPVKPNFPLKKIQPQPEIVHEVEENISDRLQKLHDDYSRQQVQIQQKQKQQIIKEGQKLKPFKVVNRKSIFLNAFNKKEPLHIRTPEILLKKEKSLNYLKQINARTPSPLDSQNEENIKILEQRALEKKFTKQEANILINRIEEREKQRLRKINTSRLMALKLEKVNGHTPSLSPYSLKLTEKQRLKRNLSQNYLKRFEEYEWDKNKRFEETIKSNREQVTPFKPQLSKKTQEIALKLSRSRSKSVFERVHPKYLPQNRIETTNRKHQGSTALQTSRQLATSRRMMKEYPDRTLKSTYIQTEKK